MNNKAINPTSINNIFYRVFRDLTLTTNQAVGAEAFSCARSSPGLSRLQRDKDLVVSSGAEQPTLTSHIKTVASHGADSSPQNTFDYLGIRDVTPKKRLEE